MNILILNWRDPKNPKSGGAERITQKYAEYWVKKGHSVWWISNWFEGGKEEETENGVKYLRIAPALVDNILLNVFRYPIYLLHVILLVKKLIAQNKVDIVIDEIHGLPFFTPLYSNKKNILLVCEVAGVIWDKMYPLPINVIGKFIEKIIYKVIYRNTEMWAISQNTKEDILRLNPKAKVKILPLGIDINKNCKLREKYHFPSAVFLARLVKMKGVEDAIEAAEIISRKFKNFKLFIIGRGDKNYEQYLKQLVKERKLDSVVSFLGYVSEEKKYEILAKSHFLIHPSYKEGFGLTVLEAGSVGTPAIVQKGSSLDELVEDGRGGFVVNGSNEISEKFIHSFQSDSFGKLCSNARPKSLSYSWGNILKASKTITGI